jgi:SNF2 family DNA or RNA helicase
MGLGKTLQTLALLQWNREQMKARSDEVQNRQNREQRVTDQMTLFGRKLRPPPP